MKFGRRMRDRTIWGRVVGGWQKKGSIFNLRTGDGILIKFDVWEDNASQSSYFKSRLDPVTLGGVGGDLKSWKTLRMEASG